LGKVGASVGQSQMPLLLLLMVVVGMMMVIVEVH
jgi:hypothetical protein